MPHRLDPVFQRLQSDTVLTGSLLYDELAPLYDFIYERHYDYAAQRDVLLRAAPDDAASVLEGASGTGRTLELLEAEFDTCVGVDLNQSMIDIAAERSRAEMHCADLRTVDLGRCFDVIGILGNSLIHFSEDGSIVQLFSNMYRHLSSDGVLVFTYLPLEGAEDGHVTIDRFTDSTYTVERTIICNMLDDDGTHEMVFSYVIENGQGISASVCESHRGRFFTDQYLREQLRGVGFDSVSELEQTGQKHDCTLVARRG